MSTSRLLMSLVLFFQCVRTFATPVTEIEVQVPGAPNAVRVQVGSDGEVFPMNFPKEIRADMKLSWAGSLVFRGRQAEEICTQVETEVTLYRALSYPEHMRRRARERIRTLSTIRFQAEAAAYFSTHAFMNLVHAELIRQGRVFNQLYLSPRIRLETLRPRILLAEDAWSRVFGDAPEQLQAIASGFSPQFGAIGLGSGEFSGADLFCDLMLGRAQILLDVGGAEVGRSERQELLNSDQLFRVMSELYASSLRFSSEASERASNRAYAAQWVAIVLGAPLPRDDLEYVLDTLLEPESGKPRTSDLPLHLVRIKTRDVPFTNSIRLQPVF